MERTRAHSAEVTQIDGHPKAWPEPSLEKLYSQHDGKAADKWSSYLREYDRIFRDVRDRPLRLLEIGIQNGGSLEIWPRYFPKARSIVGCDIDPKCGLLRYEDERVAVVIGDANTDETQRRIVQHATEFDVIIDDGSHRSSDIIRSFARYFPLLSLDGLFIIEDLHCSYWSEFEGGLFHPHASMTFLKRLADVINHEHWGVPRFRADLVRGISEEYGVVFHEQDLGTIHSIEFCNSLCVIRKAPSDENSLGIRSTVGTSEPVAEGKLALKGQRRPDRLDQTTNAWSLGRAPEEELIRKQGEIAALEARLAALDAEISSAKEQLAAATAGLSATQEQRDAAAATMLSLHDQIAALTAKYEQQSSEYERFRATLIERDLQLRRTSTVVIDLSGAIASLEKEQRALSRARSEALQKLSKAEATLGDTQQALKRLEQSISWRLTRPLRSAGELADKAAPPGGYPLAARRVRKVLREQGLPGATRRLFQLMTGRAELEPVPTTKAPLSRPPLAAPKRQGYGDWLRQYDVLKSEGRAGLAARAAAFRKQPLVTVLLSVCDPNLQWLEDAIESARTQIYPRWELCVVDNASSNPAVRLSLERFAAQDPRVRVLLRTERVGRAHVVNTALEVARGDWITLLGQSDLLREQALYRLVEALQHNQDLKLVYGDEDRISVSNARCDPCFKPDWNPDLFLSCNLIGCAHAYDAQLVREVGGMRSEFEGAEDYDLALRCVERLRPGQIHHVPRVLYSARKTAGHAEARSQITPFALSGQRALSQYLERTKVAARAEIVEGESFRVRYQLADQPPLVSLIVPTRNALELVRQCLTSIFERTTYPHYEVLLIDNGSDDAAAIAYFSGLASRPGVRVLRDDRPFNYSALNNMAVQLARGEYVCLLNNDIEVISPFWLEELISIAAQEGVGAVGARLWYPNDTLQHAGVIVGVHGIAGHAHKHLPKGSRGYLGRADLIQSYSAVTGACLAIKRSTYVQMGGLNESELKVAFNDVDLCLRLREAGYRNVWTPYANLYHHESASRGAEDMPEKVARFAGEIHYMKVRWAAELSHDPSYNPNLSLDHEDFRLAFPPRI